MKGKVYLVGAGPGDPELLTLKAARLLRSADAVLHDDLVPGQILKMISPGAMVTNVGKRCGRRSIPQEEINFLMITLASANLKVVRLKGGDPLIFGRGGEEIEALRAAKIAYEIVPGITSALGAAASAEIPLTDRRASSAVVFLTAHLAGHKDETDWSLLATSGATLVLYMPGSNYRAISRRLTFAGLSPDTPCAIVSRATTAEQQIHRTTIQELECTPRLPAPTLLIVGKVVRLGTRAAEILGSQLERMFDHVSEPKPRADATVAP
jgi:uroporphyrin-III C-methyltransferase